MAREKMKENASFSFPGGMVTPRGVCHTLVSRGAVLVHMPPNGYNTFLRKTASSLSFPHITQYWATSVLFLLLVESPVSHPWICQHPCQLLNVDIAFDWMVYCFYWKRSPHGEYLPHHLSVQQIISRCVKEVQRQFCYISLYFWIRSNQYRNKFSY